jgi:hypothetical protein
MPDGCFCADTKNGIKRRIIKITKKHFFINSPITLTYILIDYYY